MGGVGADVLAGEGFLSGEAGDDTYTIWADGEAPIAERATDGVKSFLESFGVELPILDEVSQTPDGNDVIEGGAGTAWTDVIDLGGGPGVTAAGEFGTDWTVTITNGSVEKTDTENGRLELSKDAEGSIDFSDGSKIDFAQIEEIRW